MHSFCRTHWLQAACLILASGVATAQEYPTRLVRIIVAQAPAAGPDLVARMLAQKLTESWGQQFIVENRAGANGIIGGDAVAKSKPDGYTLLLGVSSAITMNPFVYKNLPHDPLRDFAPVSQTASNTMALVVTPTLRARSAQALIALAKARHGELVYGSAGIGNLTHLSADNVQKLSREVNGYLSTAEIRERMASQGSESSPSTPEAFAAFIKAEAAKWSRVIRAAGLEHSQ